MAFKYHNSLCAPPSTKVAKKVRRKNTRKFKPDKKFCKVYGLTDAFGKIFYIGQTRMTLERRLAFHFKDARAAKTPVHRWINKSYGVDIFLIDGNATWDVSEIIYIDRFRREGHPLLNVLRGGSDTIHAVRRESAANGNILIG